jgi:hypothetical protein
MADAGLSWSDSVKFVADSAGNYDKDNTTDEYSSPAFGIYVKVQDKAPRLFATVVEAVYFSKDFFSPYGITNTIRLVSAAGARMKCM